MKRFSVHRFELFDTAAIDDLHDRVRRLERDNERLRKLLAFRARKLNPRPAPIGARTFH